MVKMERCGRFRLNDVKRERYELSTVEVAQVYENGRGLPKVGEGYEYG